MSLSHSTTWQHALASIARHSSHGAPDLAIVLGSGLGAAVAGYPNLTSIPYAEIPGLPQPTVAGHAGELLIVELSGWTIWCFSGRFHLYEGRTASEVVAPVTLAAAAGAPRLLLTNAAGAINPDFPVRSFMYIADHINFTGNNPLIGVRKNPFVDLTRLYNQELYSRLSESTRHGVTLNRGVLAAVVGPSYETPAEVRALRNLGADAVSMSTVPEAIMARYLGMDVAGLSFLSNVAAGCSEFALDHDDVLSAGQSGASQLGALLPQLIQQWQEL